MDSRADFQRLLEEMDKVIESKRQELHELDERLESSRTLLSEQEARELHRDEEISAATGDERPPKVGRGQNSATCEEQSLEKQRKLYEEQLEKFSEELNEFELINRQLVKENEDLVGKLKVSDSIIRRLENNLKELGESLEEVRAANLELNLRLAKAESESVLQQKLLRRSHDEDEVLMAAFNDKIESMKSIIDKKEEEIEQLRSENQFTIELFAITARETNHDDSSNEVLNQIDPRIGTQDRRQRAVEIAKAFREKNAQIELLKGHLLQASRDLEKNAALIERLTGRDSSLDEPRANVRDIEGVAAEKSPTMVEVASRVKMLESELEAKDKRLHLLENRNRHYETVLPAMIGDLVSDLRFKLNSNENGQNLSTEINGLANAIRELLGHLNSSQSLLDNIEQIKQEADLKDAQIRKLVKELNRLDAKFQHVQQQCQFLSSHAPTELESKNTVNYNLDLNTDGSGEDSPERLGSPEKVIKTDSIASACGAISGENNSNVRQKHALASQVLHNSSNNKSEPHCDQSKSVKSKDKGPERFALQKEQNPVMNSPGHNIETMHHQQISSDADRLDEPQRTIRNLLLDHTLPTKKTADANIDADVETTLANTTPKSMSLPRAADSSETYTLSAISADIRAQSRLRQLENENELLELAMKEILLSIKWSDAQCSTILIDCPSLERLCQLIEARFLAKQAKVDQETLNSIGEVTLATDRNLSSSVSTDRVLDSEQLRESALFQLVVLKSELDLLRGQNEQLRADVKTRKLRYQRPLNEPVEQHKLFQSESTDATDREKRLNDDSASSNFEKKAVGGPALATEGTVNVGPRQESLNRKSTSPVEEVVEGKNQLVDSGLVAQASRCSNCSRWAKASYHLTQCIMRIETRVNLSDEVFTSRLVNLHHLIRLLERDLSSRESLLEKRNRDCQYLQQQRSIAESRVQYLKGQLAVHMQVCPLIIAASPPLDGHNVHNHTSTLGIESSCKTMTSSYPSDATNCIYQKHTQANGNKSERRSPQMTINLLQSVISCMQARLDYKDDRLKQLELALSNSTHSKNPPVAYPRKSALLFSRVQTPPPERV